MAWADRARVPAGSAHIPHCLVVLVDKGLGSRRRDALQDRAHTHHQADALAVVDTVVLERGHCRGSAGTWDVVQRRLHYGRKSCGRFLQNTAAHQVISIHSKIIAFFAHRGLHLESVLGSAWGSRAHWNI